MSLRISVKSSNLDTFRPLIKSYSKPEVVIGRHSSNDFVLDQEGISERHARIRLSGSSPDKDKRLFVTDLGSASGVKIGDTKIKAYKEIEVNPEDEIQIGDFILSPELHQSYLKSKKAGFSKKVLAKTKVKSGQDVEEFANRHEVPSGNLENSEGQSVAETVSVKKANGSFVRDEVEVRVAPRELSSNSSAVLDNSENVQTMKVIKVAERKGVFGGNLFSSSKTSSSNAQRKPALSNNAFSDTNKPENSRLPKTAFKNFTSQVPEQKSFQEKLADTKAALASRKLQQKESKKGFAGASLSSLSSSLLGKIKSEQRSDSVSNEEKNSSLSKVFDEVPEVYQENSSAEQTIELQQELKDNTGRVMADSNSSAKGSNNESNPLKKIVEANKAAAAAQGSSSSSSSSTSALDALTKSSSIESDTSRESSKISGSKSSSPESIAKEDQALAEKTKKESSSSKKESKGLDSKEFTDVKKVDMDLAPKNTSSFEASMSSASSVATDSEPFTTKVNVVNIEDFDLEATKLIPIKGTVFHRGQPLSGVTIDGGEFGKTQTLADGSFHFSIVPEGTKYKVEANKEGYIINCQSPEGVASESSSVEFFATKLLSISGRVVHQGKAIEGVEIDCGRFGNITTDEDGCYIIKNVPEETEISIVAKKDGYIFKKISTSV